MSSQAACRSVERTAWLRYDWLFPRIRMSTVNSFGTRRALQVGNRTVQMYSLAALQDAGHPEIARLPYSLKILLENLLRHEDGRFVKPADIQALAQVGRQEHGTAGNLLRARSRAPAGFHRRARGGRSRGHARRHRAAGRQSESCQPAAAGGARHRSFGPGGLFQSGERIPAERGARVLAQQGAVRVPSLGAERLREFPRRAPRHRDRPPGEPRVPRPRRDVGRNGGRDARVPGHPGRHRFPHDDDQRPRGGGLGCRRHRSRSGDARPADLDAHPAGARLPADRRDARRRDRDRPRAHDHRAAAQARRRRKVRRVLRARPRTPDDCRSRHAREHVSGVRRDHRHLSRSTT